MCGDVPKFDPVSNDKTSAQTGPSAQETLHLQVFLFALNHSLQVSDTVEPRHTTTPLLRPLFCGPNKKPTQISYLKTPLIRPPRYYDQRPP